MDLLSKVIVGGWQAGVSRGVSQATRRVGEDGGPSFATIALIAIGIVIGIVIAAAVLNKNK